MKTLIVILLILLQLGITSFSFNQSANAKTKEEYQNEIAELEKKIAAAQNSAKTLAGEINYIDNQIALSNLKIAQNEDIIDSYIIKIDTLEKILEKRENELEQQILQTYKEGEISPLAVFLGSGNVGKMIQKYKYLKILQTNTRKSLYDSQKAQSSYALQKTNTESAKARQETLKLTLIRQEAAKEELLRQTKNSEAEYQKQLEQARLELIAIESALASAKKEGPVKTGDPIGLVGNSGYPSCSTGKHLHFEVRVNDEWVNAESYLKNITDKWGLNIGSGKWDWPISGDIQITQRYGKTPYSYVYKYSGEVHTGIDMLSDNDVIKAVADGDLYSYVGKCGSSALNIKYIDHGNGLKTLYLHVR